MCVPVDTPRRRRPLLAHYQLLQPRGPGACWNVRVAWRPAERLAGLMLRRDWPAGFEALLLLDCRAVHTMWMRFSIDVLYLDARGVVVGITRIMRPWRMSVARDPTARHTLELPSGSLAACDVARGDRLRASWPDASWPLAAQAAR